MKRFMNKFKITSSDEETPLVASKPKIGISLDSE